MPDFDIDFCQNGRDRVIDYVKNEIWRGLGVADRDVRHAGGARGGARRRPRARHAVPVRRRHRQADSVPARQAGRCCKRPPPRKEDRDANVIYAREAEPLLVEREAAEEEVRQLLELAEQLEGLPRNVGMHAGGVLIAPGKLTDFCPLYVQPGADAILSQFDKDDVEAVGPREVRLPGPHDADDPRLDAQVRAPARSRGRRRARRAAARRPRRLRHLQDRQYGRRVPVRIARHARAAEAGAADPLRGHHRAGRAVPAGADGADSRLRRAQVRAASACRIPTRASSRSWSPRTASWCTRNR